MNQSDRLNGNVDLLARAMRTVFSEAVQEGIKPVREDMRDMEGRLKMEIETGLKNTNKNVQAQLAQHRKDVAEQLAKNRIDLAKDLRIELARH